MKVADTHHLVRRKGVWYFRRRVPTHLVGAVGKKVIQRSLDTSNKAEAKRRRELEDVKWSARFAELEKQPIQVAVPPEAMSKSKVVELLRGYVDRMDSRFKARYAADPPESQDQKREMRANIELGLQILDDPEDIRAGERVLLAGERVLGKGLRDAPAEMYNVIAEVVRRALLEVDRRKLAYVADDHERAFFDQLFDPARRAAMTFGELADDYLEWRLQEARANDAGRKYLEKLTSRVALIREVIGADTAVAAVDFDLCQLARQKIAQTPSNRTKAFKGIALDRVIEIAAAKGLPLLSTVTQRGYLQALSDMLAFAVKKRIIASNPADGIGPLRRDPISAEDKRLPFTPDQLNSFFSCEFYRKCSTSGARPYRYDHKGGWRFWLPLISLYTGARPTEICQLTLTDVRRTEQGTWYFDVVADRDDEEDVEQAAPKKRLKTATSRRKIPIHPELVRIGLLAYVDELNQSGAEVLFPTLKPDANGYLSTYPLKRFRETFLRQAVTLNRRQTFYSFRHCFRDALRALEPPQDTLLALGGWSQGRNASDNYGTRSHPDLQRKYVEQIVYPGLDLSHLWTTDIAEDTPRVVNNKGRGRGNRRKLPLPSPSRSIPPQARNDDL